MIATLGSILGGVTLAKSVLVMMWPREYLELWRRPEVPECLRKEVEPWLAVPDDSLRISGLGGALIGVVLLSLASRAR